MTGPSTRQPHSQAPRALINGAALSYAPVSAFAYYFYYPWHIQG